MSALKKKSQQGQASENTAFPEALAELGLVASLPWLVCNDLGHLVESNPRMSEWLRKPLGTGLDWFPFSTDEHSGERLLRQVLGVGVSTMPRKVMVSRGNDPVALWVHRPSRREIWVVAKPLRSGDLLADRSARQQLFHQLSHEIRTATMTLKLQISEVGESSGELAKRMRQSVDRLDQVVAKLDSLKTELKE